MIKHKILLILIAAISLTSCKKNSDSGDDYATEVESEYYPDGTYCADIEYYNPDTGTRSTYTLNVEVESNEVTVIQWPNGGWLDSSHFNSEELDSDGSCSITAFDGKQYDIQITGSECVSTDAAVIESDEEETTCPQCNGIKYEYEDICENCKDKAEHTCTRCGQHDSFMFSTDDLCSDCKRDDEENEREQNE
jgi:hypothetical protein